MTNPLCVAPSTPSRTIGRRSSTAGGGYTHSNIGVNNITPSKLQQQHGGCGGRRGSATATCGGRIRSSILPRMSPAPVRRMTSSYQSSSASASVYHTPSKGTPYYTPRTTAAATVVAASPTTTSNTNTSAICDNNDRYIPSRRRMNMDMCRRTLLLSGTKRSRDETSSNTNNNPSTGGADDSSTTNSPSPNKTTPTTCQETPLQKEFKRRMLSSLCNVPLDQLNDDGHPTGILSFGSATKRSNSNGSTSSLFSTTSSTTNSITTTTVGGYHQHQQFIRQENPFSHDTLRTVLQQCEPNDGLCDPISQQNNTISKKIHRKVSSAPARILDAPGKKRKTKYGMYLKNLLYILYIFPKYSQTFFIFFLLLFFLLLRSI